MRFCLKTSRCFSLLVAAGCIIFTSGCQSMKRPAYSEQGWASYIADAYEGRPTSSGAFYDPRAYTAAHNTLPFGTVVTVKNQQNGQKVDVVVNDRFPHYPGRVINVSGAAGMAIGIPPFQLAPVAVSAREIGPPGGGMNATPGYAGGYAPSGGTGVPPPVQQGQPNYTRQTMAPIFGGSSSAAPPPAMGGYNPAVPPSTYSPPPTYAPPPSSIPSYVPPAGGGIPPAGSGLGYPPGGDRGL